ncbi:MAG: succinate dehydrogenase cytochrome b subunit [Marinilabiliaceae bacterium]|nr:succinate dehydrogenase cytochrome b subunit [Marinilabiliaceae bacterium]
MKGFLKSSIGKKFVMGTSGLFLFLFLMIHLLLNSFLLISDNGKMFNTGAHFMATNPFVKIIEPLLAIGFIVHIFMGIILTIQNRKARGNERYAVVSKSKNVLWASKNMFILGVMIFAFLLLHLYHFWLKMKFTGSELLNYITIDIGGVPTQVENVYALINLTFSNFWIVIIYITASLALGLHLSHGIWSGFQTIGLSNTIWQKIIKKISIIFAIIVGIGFSTIAAAQYLFFQ